MPLNPNPAYQPDVPVDKSVVLAKGVFRVGNADELRDNDWTAAGIIGINNEWFYRDTSDTISSDNDSTIIVDQAGTRWKRMTGGSLAVHAAGLFEDRDDYNSEESPRADGTLFVYFSTDGDGDTITDGVFFFKLSDGNSWSDPVLFRGPRGGDRYEISNWDTDRPAAGEEVIAHICTTEVTFPANFLGSIAKALVLATGTAVYSIRKNGVQIGTLTFTSASLVGVYAMASEAIFAIGDRFSVIAPNPRDETLSGVSQTHVGAS